MISVIDTPIGNPAVVLVVEDEPLQRMMVIDLVHEAGFSAIEALDADDAIRILMERPDIHVVFTDIDMPHGIDGMKLAEAIRDRWPPIELIITSARRWLEDKDMPERGVFISKPYELCRVVETIRRFVGD